MEDQTQDADDDYAADTKVDAAEAISATTTSAAIAAASALVPAIFNIVIRPAWRPFHNARIPLAATQRKGRRGVTSEKT
jgi:hypothetical protein